MGKEILTDKEKILDGAKRIDDTILDGAKRVADDVLAGVSGGAVNATDNIGNVRGAQFAKAGENPNLAGGVQRHYCIKCKKDTAHKVYMGNRLVCEECGTSPTL